jgi:hypothetical protein
MSYSHHTVDGLTKRPNHDSKLRSPLLATKSFSAESKNRVISDTGSKNRGLLMFRRSLRGTSAPRAVQRVKERRNRSFEETKEST